LKRDENVAVSVAPRLRSLGFDADTAIDEGLRGHPDENIWRAAQAEGRFLITQDLDFSDSRRFAPGTHHGILVVRLPDSEQWRIGDFLVAWFSEPDVRTWGGCFVVGGRPTKFVFFDPSERPPDLTDERSVPRHHATTRWC
jgi:predicted nuclease of predicted toxin-antitoxin system